MSTISWVDIILGGVQQSCGLDDALSKLNPLYQASELLEGPPHQSFKLKLRIHSLAKQIETTNSMIQEDGVQLRNYQLHATQ
jgi:hypothetical protein